MKLPTLESVVDDLNATIEREDVAAMVLADRERFLKACIEAVRNCPIPGINKTYVYGALRQIDLTGQ